MEPTDPQVELLHYYAVEAGFALTVRQGQFALVPFGCEAVVLTGLAPNQQDANILINHLAHIS